MITNTVVVLDYDGDSNAYHTVDVFLLIYNFELLFMKELRSRNACYNSVQDLLYYSLLSKNTKIKILSFISNLSDDRSTASSKTIPPLNAI
jgi:hypothetical protein